MAFSTSEHRPERRNGEKRRVARVEMALLAAVLSVATEAKGQDIAADALLPMPPTGEPETGDPVRGLLADAIAEYDAARYLEAQALFRRAHELAPSARTLRGIGMASFEAGQYVTALRALRAALSETERPLTDAQRRHVRSLIARTEVFVARLVVEASPPDAELQVDGETPTRESDGSILLDPGLHRVTLLGPRGRTESVAVPLVGGTTRTLRVHVASLERESPSPFGVAGGGLLGVALLGTVAALATGSLALDTHAQVRQACDGFVCPDGSVSVRDRALALALATDVVGVSSAVLAAVGATLVVLGAALERPPPIAVATGPNAAMGISVTF